MQSILRSSSFRLLLLYLSLFALSASALLGVVYWATAGFMEREAKATIEAEIQGLAEHYRTDELTGLLDTIQSRLDRNPTSASIYLLTDAFRNPILGNINHLPEALAESSGWVELSLSREQVMDDTPHHALAQVFIIKNRFYLLVGRDVEVLHRTKRMIQDAMVLGLGVTLLMGLIGGLIFSRGVLSRIDRINQTCRHIVQGDLSDRVPVHGSSDELDVLASNFNHMLDQLDEMVENVKRVSDNIAHDMRTPLSRLRQRIEEGLMQPRSEEEYRELLGSASEEVDQLINTFNALLRIAKIEAKQRKDGFEALDLKQLLADVVELYEPLGEDKEQTVHFTMADELNGDFIGDRHLLFQALANLLDNAIKYSPEGGDICVSFTLVDGQRVIRVQDSGEGIAPENHKRVMQRFFRQDSSRTTKGVGLGLSLVNAVFKLHNIHIRFENQDKGMAVICQLPA